LSGQPVVHILKVLVLLEPLLTAVAMRVLPVLITNTAWPAKPVVAPVVLLEPLLTAVAMRVLPVLITNTAWPAKPVVAPVVLMEPMLTASRVLPVLLEPLLTTMRAKANFTKKLWKGRKIVVVIIGLLLSRRKIVMRLRHNSILPGRRSPMLFQ